LNHYEKILSRSHSNYLAQISIEMTDANNQINDVLSKLTALGTVLIPMNLVTGLWGMNVHVPGEGGETVSFTAARRKLTPSSPGLQASSDVWQGSPCSEPGPP
jgi:Mg2+ and Co2+ transporter CorA